jgi:hypothetical protein
MATFLVEADDARPHPRAGPTPSREKIRENGELSAAGS